MEFVSERSNPYLSHKANYSSLIVRFITTEVGARHFVRQFSRLWKKDRDAQWALRERWDQPYDEQLQAALLKSEIDRAEFLQRWNELWGFPSEQDAAFLDMLDRIFTASDSFSADPKAEAPDDERGLRRFVAQTYSSYFVALADKMATSH